MCVCLCMCTSAITHCWSHSCLGVHSLYRFISQDRTDVASNMCFSDLHFCLQVCSPALHQLLLCRVVSCVRSPHSTSHTLLHASLWCSTLFIYTPVCHAALLWRRYQRVLVWSSCISMAVSFPPLCLPHCHYLSSSLFCLLSLSSSLFGVEKRWRYGGCLTIDLNCSFPLPALVFLCSSPAQGVCGETPLETLSGSITALRGHSWFHTEISDRYWEFLLPLCKDTCILRHTQPWL